MNVSLTPQLEAFVRELVGSGRYNSASEVVREALRFAQEREQVRAIKLEALREEIRRGLESPSLGEWDVEAFLNEARETFAEGNVAT